MTKKEIILKSSEDLNDIIIREKGNTKCIFYSDNVCRNGDKTRDCINCARVEYTSLYSLNWDNQERLQKQLQFVTDTLEKVLEAEVYLYKTYIDKTFTGNFDWGNDKVSIHLEKFIKDSIEHIKFIDETNKILYQEKCELLEENKTLKQALQEIKELITNSFDSCYVCNGKDSCEKCLQGEILQKCEVLDE